MTYEEKYRHLVSYIDIYKKTIENVDVSGDSTLELGVYGGIKALEAVLTEISKLEEN